MSGFKLDDSYVEVAERIRIFRDKFPEGSLQSEIWFGDNDAYVLCIAWAYRSADDARPGIGHSRLAIPGTTPYTRGSEVENAETSAWGRAIIAALAADAKRIASADEVRAKHDETARTDPRVGAAVSGGASANPPDPAPVAESSFKVPEKAQQGVNGFEESSAANVPQEQRNREAAGRVKVHFGKNVDKTIGELTQKQVAWYAGDGWLETTQKALDEGKKQKVTSKDLQLRQAARTYLAIEPAIETSGPFDVDSDVPF